MSAAERRRTAVGVLLKSTERHAARQPGAPAVGFAYLPQHAPVPSRLATLRLLPLQSLRSGFAFWRVVGWCGRCLVCVPLVRFVWVRLLTGLVYASTWCMYAVWLG
jgi:hypothetical protein